MPPTNPPKKLTMKAPTIQHTTHIVIIAPYPKCTISKMLCHSINIPVPTAKVIITAIKVVNPPTSKIFIIPFLPSLFY